MEHTCDGLTIWYDTPDAPLTGGTVVVGARPSHPANTVSVYWREDEIQDDVLNLIGEEKKYGKEIGGDLWEGKRTLILVDLLSKMGKFEAERLQAIFAKPRSRRLARDVEWIQERVRHYGSTDAALASARRFADASLREFDVSFGDAPESEDKAFVHDLVQYVVTRDL